MATYKFQKHISSEEPIAVFYVEGNVSIPFDESNTDYKEYLKWVAEGNTPEPADEV